MSKVLLLCCILSLLFVMNLAEEVPNAGGLEDSKVTLKHLGLRSSVAQCVRDCHARWPNSTARCPFLHGHRCACLCYVP
ncbi:unnamed protein product [Coffea canephora]|uniref:Knottin scorpion toxin-like domain-containing protein n=1 Tax=Coffea canephora TaxID=49390 RepID=A0A068TR50_COFCA|nr:unnamed protein product [Coffea canephora]